MRHFEGTIQTLDIDARCNVVIVNDVLESHKVEQDLQIPEGDKMDSYILEFTEGGEVKKM